MIYLVEDGTALSVQFAIHVEQKIHLARIFEIPEISWILLLLEVENGHLNIRIMHKAPKYFRNNFVTLATNCGGAPNFALNVIDVLDVNIKNRQKHIGHVGYALDNIIAPAWDKRDLFVLVAKNEL